MNHNIKDFSLKKKFCPILDKNVVIQIDHDQDGKEICLNHTECSNNGDCINKYNNLT